MLRSTIHLTTCRGRRILVIYYVKYSGKDLMGKVVFSYDDSASQIEVSQVQSVNWNKDGIQYDLLQIDGKLSAGELADMAREVINNRR